MSQQDTHDHRDEVDADIQSLLEQAQLGDEVALGRLLQWSREFLRREAHDTLGPQLRVRVDESDLVQKVCLAAYEQFGQFRGHSAAEFIQWLRRILERDLLDVVERERDAAKRAVDREEPGSKPLQRAVARQTSPSRRAIRAEERILILETLEQLPDDQREAVRIKYLDHATLQETAARMGKTEDAVSSLLHRGMKKLNALLRTRGLDEP